MELYDINYIRKESYFNDSDYISIDRVPKIIKDDIRYFYETQRNYPCYCEYRETDKPLTKLVEYRRFRESTIDKDDKVLRYFGPGILIGKYKKLLNTIPNDVLNELLFIKEKVDTLEISKGDVDRKVQSILNKVI